MKGKFYIISMGMGYSSLTVESLDAIEKSSILVFTSTRLLNSYKMGCGIEIKKRVIVSYLDSEINEILESRDLKKSISIIVSGDVGFYSFASHFKSSDAIFLSGISSMSSLSSHFHIDYSQIKSISIHGRDERFAISAIRRNEYSFILLPTKLNSFVELLTLYGFENLNVYFACDISGEDERFLECLVKDLIDFDDFTLKAIIVENPKYDCRVRSGIEDEFFIRENKIPMTKKTIRSLIYSKLNLHPSSIVWDIGCGSGSVTVESGLAVYDGWVYAVDVKKDAVELTRKNLIKAKVANCTLVESLAPLGLDDFKKPDAIFIGGSNNNIDKIVEYATNKNPKVKIVMTALSLDTLCSALALPFDWDIVQIQSSNSKKIGTHHLMSGENPIYVLSCGGSNE